MKKHLFFITVLLISLVSFSQEKTKAFQDGEWLRYRMSYSGFLKAGVAELSLKEETLNGKKVIHATGKGRTSNVVGWFFKVRDTYQSYFDMETGVPYLFKRKVREGGFRMHKQIQFNPAKNKAKVTNFRSKEEFTFDVGNVQDMISTFYFLRKYDVTNMKPGESIQVDMFFDEKTYPFKLKFLGYETLKTPFGKVKTMIFRPIVKAGRVFKEKESVMVWITADHNKIPIKMKASLAVGSLRAELDAYKGLANSFEVVFD